MSERRIIRGATIMPLEGRRTIRRGDVLLDGGVIAAIGGVGPGENAQVEERRGVLLPGFVQAHVHLDVALLDRELVPSVDPWRLRAQLASWLAVLDDRGIEVQAASAIARGLRAGAVAFADAGGQARRLLAIDAAATFGVRLVATLDATRRDVGRDLDVLEPVVEERGAKGLVTLAVWAGDAERTPARRLAAAARAASERKLPLFVHLGTMPGDRDGVRRLERARVVGKNLVLCHGSGASLAASGVANALGAAGASVVLTPGSDLLTGAPPPPVGALVQAKVNLALGSDSAMTRAGFDPFRELRLLAAMLQEQVDAPFTTALEIATAGGARALGLESGAVEVGRRADLLTLQLPVSENEDHETIARRIIERGGPALVRDVWVDGRPAARGGELTGDQGPSPRTEDDLRWRLLGAAAKRARHPAHVLALASAAIRDRLSPREGWHSGRLPP